MKLQFGAGPSKNRFKPSRQIVGVVGSVAIAAYLGLMTFLNTSNPFVVTRGTSMEPVYREGDLLVIRKVPAAQLGPGDLIVFDVPEQAQRELRMPPRAAHRIVRVSAEDGELAYVTKGDNSDVDPFKVKSGAVTGLIVKNLGQLGRPILLLSNARFLLFMGLPIAVFVVVVFASLKSSSTQGSKPKPTTSIVPGRSSLDYSALDTESLEPAISEYGAYLKSHAAIFKGMSSTYERPEESVWIQNVNNRELNDAVRNQNQILSGLLIAVENLQAKKFGDDKPAGHDNNRKATRRESKKVGVEASL